MAGIVGMSLGARNTALSGMKRAADLEEAQENTNRALKENYKNTRKASIASGMAVGAQIGATFTPVGAVIGAVIGGLVGWGASS